MVHDAGKNVLILLIFEHVLIATMSWYITVFLSFTGSTRLPRTVCSQIVTDPLLFLTNFFPSFVFSCLIFYRYSVILQCGDKADLRMFVYFHIKKNTHITTSPLSPLQKRAPSRRSFYLNLTANLSKLT